MRLHWQRRRGLLLGLTTIGLVSLPLAAVLAQGPGSGEEHKCIYKMNRAGISVVLGERVVLTKCIKAYAEGTKQSAEDCSVTNFQGKVVRKKQAVKNVFKKRCLDDNGGAPSFGAQDPNAVITAAITKEVALIHEIFGSDLDSSIRLADPNHKATFSCQYKVAKAVIKCQTTKLKVYARCKARGLKEGAITDSQSLQDTCLGVGSNPQPDPDGKIARECTDQLLDQRKPNRIARALSRKCEELAVDLSEAFGDGVCASAASQGAAELEACLELLAECRACRWANATDLLNRDCDLFDDGLANESCP